MAEYLLLVVRDADMVIEMLPEVGLQGARLPDLPDLGEQVKIVPQDLEDAESIWFELSWHSDKLGIIGGTIIDEPDEETS